MARVSDFDRYLIGQGLGLLVVGVGAFVSPFLINGGVIGLMVLSREARSATGDAWLGIAMTAVSSALTGVVMTLGCGNAAVWARPKICPTLRQKSSAATEFATQRL